MAVAAARAIEARGPTAVARLPEHRGRVLLRRVASGVEAVLAVLPERFAAARLRATEVSFDEGRERGPIDLGDGAIAIGRIDRIDAVTLPDGRVATGVVDYKLGAGGAVGYGRWEATATLQVALYLYAATAGTDDGPPAYALYQPAAPLSGIDPGARRPAGVEVGGLLDGRAKGPDDAEEVAAIVAAVHAQAVAAVASLRAGTITPLPGHSVHGDAQECDHPAIARLLP